MNTRISTLSVLALIVPLTLTAARAAAPLGTGLAYQGQLKQNGAPANGNLDMAFRLFDAAALGEAANQTGEETGAKIVRPEAANAGSRQSAS